MMTLLDRAAMREQAAQILDADADQADAWLYAHRHHRVAPGEREKPAQWRRMAAANRRRAEQLRACYCTPDATCSHCTAR